jgi:hypothetical protein
VSAHFEKAADIGTREGLYLDDEHASVLYRARGPRLIVTFCNLASFEYDDEVRLPWLTAYAEARGFSQLGVMAHRKDWYRNAGTPKMIGQLAREGLFDEFEHVLFTGTSMGGFAALIYSALVPGSDVLAFSPQSTLNTDIAPFETRYPWPKRKFNWTDPEYLDAAQYVHHARQAVAIYDPMLAPDKAHVARLGGPPLDPVAVRFMGHQTPNALKRAGVLEPVLDMCMDGEFDRRAFYAGFRKGRRAMTDWRKSMVKRAISEGRTRRARTVCQSAMETMPGPWFRKTLETLDTHETEAHTP